MSGSNVNRERETVRLIKAVIACKGARFVDILEAAEIDPRAGLRFRNLSRLSFVKQDLRGLDFTGADLSGCDFTDALIEDACFDQARLGNIFNPGLKTADFKSAKDWNAFILKKPQIKQQNNSDSHLAVGSQFSLLAVLSG